MTPTQRTVLLLRKDGYLAETVEKWVPYARCRRDLFHFADVLALHPVRKEVAMIQTTSRDHVSHRLTKIRSIPELPAILAAGVKVLVHGWKKSKRSHRWECRTIEITLADLEPAATEARGE